MPEYDIVLPCPLKYLTFHLQLLERINKPRARELALLEKWVEHQARASIQTKTLPSDNIVNKCFHKPLSLIPCHDLYEAALHGLV